MSTQFDVRRLNNHNPASLGRWQLTQSHHEVNYTPNKCHASAPTLSELTSGQRTNAQEVTSSCHCNSFLNEVPVQLRKGIVSYLSSGDQTSLSITPQNHHFFRKFADDINHRQLKSILDNLNGNCGGTICRGSINSPMFEVMFRPMTDNHNNQVQVFDIRKNIIHTIEVKKITRFGEGFSTCAVYVRDCPYILISGGYGKTQTTIEKYDVVENKWAKCCSLKNSRIKHRMVFVGRSAYIIGGKTSASIERYDIANNNSEEITTLPIRVHSFAATTYGDNVFIFGGKSQNGDVACVQCLDTRSGKVHRWPDLPYKCSGGQAIVVKDQIYFATNHGHMIKFDPTSGQSILCSQQPYIRKHFTMFSNQDRLCIFGGLRTEGPVESGPSSMSPNSMYIYDPDSDTWTFERSYNETVSVYSSCTVRYPKECPVKPFMKLFGYC
ncbi:hypothetical protein ACF0H5_007587 [Mactra antiquata]